MITIKTALNSLGIILTMIGVWSLWKTSPVNFTVIDAGGAGSNFKEINKKRRRKNRIMDSSAIMILVGSGLQLISNFLPE